MLEYNCEILPGSLTGGKFVQGCPGALSSNGIPKRSYCENTGDAIGRFPWWAACCEWKQGICVPKELGKIIWELTINPNILK